MSGYTYGATRRFDTAAVEADEAHMAQVRAEAGWTRTLFDRSGDYGFREALRRHLNALDIAPATRVVSPTTAPTEGDRR